MNTPDRLPQERQPLIHTFLERNSRLNLSAIRDPQGVYIKHILDSVELANIVTLTPGATLLDVGTGGGFPLLPLAIQYPETICRGIDAARKKINTINHMIKELDLRNASAIWGRVEQHKECYDYVTARAVAYSDIIIPQLVRLINPGGSIILYKLLTPEEDALITNLCHIHHLQIAHKHIYALKQDEQDKERAIYILQKQS